MKKTAWIVALVALVACLVPDFGEHDVAHHGVHAIPAFDALFGAGAAALLVLAAVVLGKCLHREPGYYDREGGEGDA